MKNNPGKRTLKIAQVLRQKLTLHQVLLTTAIGILISVILFILFNITSKKEAFSTTNETLSAGSFIIDVGITPQTVANGLKPYGLIYDLISNYNVPVKWVIEPSKLKDGIDFTYNSYDYKGGPFIIPAEYINAGVDSQISYWQTLGVQGTYTTTSITVPVYETITTFPTILIDTLSSNQGIIINYYDSAGIPSRAYSTGAPASLTSCHDMWVNPHGDPTWATHSYLYNFVTVQKSYIWSECHAVSNLEGCENTVSPFQRLNYLTTNGLKCWKTTGTGAVYCGPSITETHPKPAVAPFTYYYPADPVAQFMGTMSGACANGSEQWFRPQVAGGGGWRTATKRIVTTATGTSPTEGVLMVYGPGYGADTNGMVMYVGGHDFTTSGTISEQVAVQRAFLNFMLLAGKAKAILFSSYSIPTTYIEGFSQTVSVTVTSGMPPYTYQWTSSLGGTFTDPTAATTEYTPPMVSSTTTEIITCIVTDACGRQNFISQIITINTNPLPVTLSAFTAEPVNNSSVYLSWTTVAEVNNDYFTIERSSDGKLFSELNRVAGAGNSTQLKKYYSTDVQPLNGISYYRLKQTDFNGRSETFKTVKVTITSKQSTLGAILISPNPFTDSFTAQFESLKKEEARFQLLNTNGMVVFDEKIMVEQGKNNFRFTAPSNLKPGSYDLRIINSTSVLSSTKVICSNGP